LLLFFAVTIAVGHYLLPWLWCRFERFMFDEFEFSMLLMVAMGFALLAVAGEAVLVQRNIQPAVKPSPLMTAPADDEIRIF
jgi:Tfp pilus assembly protein PilN